MTKNIFIIIFVIIFIIIYKKKEKRIEIELDFDDLKLVKRKVFFVKYNVISRYLKKYNLVCTESEYGLKEGDIAKKLARLWGVDEGEIIITEMIEGVSKNF